MPLRGLDLTPVCRRLEEECQEIRAQTRLGAYPDQVRREHRLWRIGNSETLPRSSTNSGKHNVTVLQSQLLKLRVCTIAVRDRIPIHRTVLNIGDPKELSTTRTRRACRKAVFRGHSDITKCFDGPTLGHEPNLSQLQLLTADALH